MKFLLVVITAATTAILILSLLFQLIGIISPHWIVAQFEQFKVNMTLGVFKFSFNGKLNPISQLPQNIPFKPDLFSEGLMQQTKAMGAFVSVALIFHVVAMAGFMLGSLKKQVFSIAISSNALFLSGILLAFGISNMTTIYGAATAIKNFSPFKIMIRFGYPFVLSVTAICFDVFAATLLTVLALIVRKPQTKEYIISNK